MEQPNSQADAPVKSRADMTDEEKKRLKEEKKARKEAEKRAKAERKAQAAKAAADALASSQALTEGIEFLTIEKEPSSLFGNYRVIQSNCPPSGSGRTFVPVANLPAQSVSSEVWVRARVHKAVFTGQVAFLTLRQAMETVQAVVSGKDMIKWARKQLTSETIIDVHARISTPEGGVVEKCSIGTVELVVSRLYIVSKADEPLPFTLDDAARPPVDAVARAEEAKDGSERVMPHVSRDTRLDSRVVDLRVAPHASLLRLQSAICQLFREKLYALGFTEIHSPKLIAGASEGGSDVFELRYFGNKACLAQSPQLYKQMAICADFQRVFEIGPVFRAEKSHTHRHLCEFTGLDLEMEIVEHYSEILDMLDTVFTSIFDGLEARFGRELGHVRKKWAVEQFKYSPGRKQLRLSWPEGIGMLREAGVTIGDLEDLNTEKEKLLGRLVREKYGTDFFMLTHFPSAIRPFYTMVDPKDGNYSNSYDVFMRGEEIISGAQRIHDVELLKVRAKAMLGEEGLASIKGYVDAFKYGAAPHGGAGIGLERVLMLYLGVENIRECSLFPRDPERLTP